MRTTGLGQRLRVVLAQCEEVGVHLRAGTVIVDRQPAAIPVEAAEVKAGDWVIAEVPQVAVPVVQSAPANRPLVQVPIGDVDVRIATDAEVVRKGQDPVEVLLLVLVPQVAEERARAAAQPTPRVEERPRGGRVPGGNQPGVQHAGLGQLSHGDSRPRLVERQRRHQMGSDEDICAADFVDERHPIGEEVDVAVDVKHGVEPALQQPAHQERLEHATGFERRELAELPVQVRHVEVAAHR